ncbi:MAG: serine/threonine-protein kinase [Rubrivivax sp.]
MPTGAVDPLAPGRRFAGCIVEREIARGAHGRVLAGFDEAAGAWRALKVVSPQSADGAAAADDAERRFQQEARTAARLAHPDLVRVHRAGREQGIAYLVMDLLTGCTVERYTRPARRLPVPVVLQLGARVARALAHAHAHGVIHRDLKPANVIVDWAADRLTLTDFGVARDEDAAERTRTGLVLGSPSYMAPELLAGGNADAATDVYALGVLLYELLAGERPFDAPGLGELLRRVAREPAPDLRQAQPALPAGLAALVAQALAKQPAQRPPGMAALAAALDTERAALAG